MGTLELYGYAAVAVLAMVTLLWMVSVALRDASIIDVFWGPLFIAIAWVLLSATVHSAGFKHLLVVFLVTAWGLRLAFHLAARNFGKGEDVRYRLWRSHGGELWWLKTFYRVYLLQGAIALVVATPIVAAFRVTDAPFLINWIGLPIWLAGFFIETGRHGQDHSVLAQRRALRFHPRISKMLQDASGRLDRRENSPSFLCIPRQDLRVSVHFRIRQPAFGGVDALRRHQHALLARVGSGKLLLWSRPGQIQERWQRAK